MTRTSFPSFTYCLNQGEKQTKSKLKNHILIFFFFKKKLNQLFLCINISNYKYEYIYIYIYVYMADLHYLESFIIHQKYQVPKRDYI